MSSDFDNTGIIFLEEGDFDGKVLLSRKKPVTSGLWFIMIQASYCGWCTKAKPEFVKAAAALQNDHVKFATIHVDSEDSKTSGLSGQISDIFGQKVSGIPAFFLYDASTHKSIKYDGKATQKSFVEFLNNHI